MAERATGTVPAEYGEFWRERAAVPSWRVLLGSVAAWLAAVGLGTLSGGPLGEPALLAVLGGFLACVAANGLSALLNGRREERLRRDPSLFYRVVETSVTAEDGTVVPLSYRLYADGSTTVPEAAWAVPAAG